MANPFDWFSGMLGGGDPEAEGAAQNSMAMQPNVLGYAQNVLSGKYAREGVLGQPRPYDPALSYRENVPDLRASLEPAMDVAMGVGPGAIRAFHGSPFDFSRFDMSKIGTGEGAQAYGHGLYFAEAEPVARRYRDTLSGNAPFDLEHEAIQRAVPLSRGARIEFMRQAGAGADPAQAAKWLQNASSETRQYSVDQLAALISDYQKAKQGRMYEVNINADPQRLLDWDKPLSQQSPGVQGVLADRFGMRPHTGGDMEFHKYPAGMYGGPDPTGGSIYQRLIQNTSPTGLAKLNAPPRISQELSEVGVPGIRYLDQGSRGAGTGSSNYVVFNDKLVEILRKYGIVPPVAGGAGAMALPGEDGGGF